MASVRSGLAEPVTSSVPGTLEAHIEQNIESILAVQKRDWDKTGHLQKAIEKLSGWMSRPGYLVALVVLIIAWLAANLGIERLGYSPWDKVPFAVLDSVMTLVALVTGTVVLVAQQRQGKLEQQHSQLALQISLLTEQKTSKLIVLLEELRRDLPMVKDRHDAQASVLQQSADAEGVLSTLNLRAQEHLDENL